MFRVGRGSVTQQLTSAAYGLKARRQRPLAVAVVLFTVIACGTAFALRPIALSPEAELRQSAEQLQGENNRLKSELQQAALKIQHEVATREELQKQLAAASSQQKKLQDELDFIRSRSK